MSTLQKFSIPTEREGFTDITAQVRLTVQKSGIRSGICVVYCPHTTAAVTVNENADPDVVRDLLLGLTTAFPTRGDFRHFEGNSHAHLKASALGASLTFIVEGGDLLLGTWQAVYFCEFDGPRERNFYVKVAAS